MTPTNTAAASANRHHYMVSPGWDLMFIINVPWVLFALADVLHRDDWLPDLHNLRYFYLSVPHRFMTLALVFLDREQFSRRPRMFVGLPLGFGALVLAAAFLGTGTFFNVQTLICILTVDYIWNAYHFASQHYGIARIYGRKAGGGRPALEKAILVPGISWAIITAANWTLVDGPLRILFMALDGIVVLGFAVLLAIELRSPKRSVPKLIYLFSVTSLYGGLVVFPYLGWQEARLGLMAGAGYFHAVEYLGIVHFYVKGKQRGGGFKQGAFRLTAPIWTQTLVLFLLTIGTLGLMAENTLSDGVNLTILSIASFTHYAFDGMIWKLRKPSVSKALGAEGDS